MDKLREGKQRSEYERDGLDARLQRAQRESEKCVDAVNHVQAMLANCKDLNFADLQKHVEEHWLKMCHHLNTLLAERVVEAR